MEIKDIIDNLENFDNGLLNDIVDQIANIKKHRQENECYEIAKKLNELLKPIVDILEELRDKDMIGDCDYLIGNSFIVREDGEGSNWIDLEY